MIVGLETKAVLCSCPALNQAPAHAKPRRRPRMQKLLKPKKFSLPLWFPRQDETASERLPGLDSERFHTPSALIYVDHFLSFDIFLVQSLFREAGSSSWGPRLSDMHEPRIHSICFCEKADNDQRKKERTAQPSCDCAAWCHPDEEGIQVRAIGVTKLH